MCQILKCHKFISTENNDDAQEFNQSDEIFLIDKALCEPLLSIANKLLCRQHLNFDQLTPPEQQLWKLFKKSDIYEFLRGQKDTVPEWKKISYFLSYA